MKKMTEENLKTAFSGESQAHMKYTIFADVAEENGYKNVARLFRAIAYAERVHATNHLRELGSVKETKENLQMAIDGENYEVEEMYPAFKAVAELQREFGALRSINYALQAEKIHSAMYTKAKQFVEEGRDPEIKEIQVCPVCGYTVEGEAPEKCPVCGTSRDKFRKF
ncbi:MAG: rubrerythrin family protein [Candidatus Methanomethyliaceae archaeon]